jgi:hypothetical protein
MGDDLPNGVVHADDFLELQLTEGSTKVRIETLKNVQQELSDPGKFNAALLPNLY